MVDPAGRVAGCNIAISSKSPSLDARTCHLFTRRARFSPARDASGRAVTGATYQMINWKLPADEPIELVDYRQRAVFTIAPDGGIKGCVDEIQKLPRGRRDGCSETGLADLFARQVAAKGKDVRLVVETLFKLDPGPDNAVADASNLMRTRVDFLIGETGSVVSCSGREMYRIAKLPGRPCASVEGSRYEVQTDTDGGPKVRQARLVVQAFVRP